MTKLKNPNDLINAKAHLESLGFKVEFAVDANANEAGFRTSADYRTHPSTILMARTPSREVELTLRVNQAGNFQLDQLLEGKDRICVKHDLGTVSPTADGMKLLDRLRPLVEALAA